MSPSTWPSSWTTVLVIMFTTRGSRAAFFPTRSSQTCGPRTQRTRALLPDGPRRLAPQGRGKPEIGTPSTVRRVTTPGAT
jgi:hypothetical protein